MTKNTIFSYIFIFTLLSTLPLLESASCDDQIQETNTQEKPKTLQLKLVAIASILLAGALGITIPIYGNKTSTFNPENNIFFLIKAFAAGVILATGFVHIFPDAFESLSNPCLEQNPWGQFPFAGFVAMISAIFTMMIDCLATGYYKRCHVDKEVSNGDEEKQGKAVDVHTHASHGHAHAHGSDHLSSLFRHRVVSQVLEVGIAVHSVVIGISVGASKTTDVIKPLVGALTFHQFFEGMGLGGCISQANFRRRATGVMVVFFSVTTPVGIGIGIGISQTYNENTSTALVVQGVLSSASAGILIYMALVDLLAQDFMNPKLQANFRLQLAAYLSLLLGMSCMSVLAKWA